MMRSFQWLAAAALAAATLTGTAWAERPTVDREFVDAHLGAISGYSEKAQAVTSPEDGMAMVVKLIAYRDQTLSELNQKHPLTSPDGIETQDALDGSVVSALDRLARAAVATDTTQATPEEAQAFANALGPLPDMGNSPLGFMVVDLARMVASTADTLGTAGTMSRRVGARFAMQIVATAGDRYFAAREGEEQASNSQNLRQSAMIMRLRCPKDGGIYHLNNRKNQVTRKGDVVSLYYLQCTVCATPLLLEFPYELATKLNKMSDTQKLATPPRPLQPTTVDP